MAAIGADLRGKFFRRMFEANNPAGLGLSVALSAGLVVLNFLLQVAFGLMIQFALYGAVLLNRDNTVRGVILGIFPAAVVTAIVAWYAAKIRGGSPQQVLNLRWPRLGPVGWAAVVCGFISGVFVLFGVLLGGLKLIGIEQNPGGLVEQAMSAIANDPSTYLLLMPSVIIGAPLAEELIFRGQLFTALSQTRLGFSGAAVLTSAAWSLMHYTGNWVLVGLIFIMGLVLGWLLYRFGSLWVTMACHATWNTMTSLVIFALLPS